MNHSQYTISHEFVKPFLDAACLMDALLELHTGLSPLERKSLTYYSLATHSLPQAKRFPQAKLHGPPGTGKSTAARIARLFVYRPLCFSARGSSNPAFRNKLTQAHEGTVIVEEGDAVWKGDTWFETLLSDRYDRDTAKEAHMVPNGCGGWNISERLFFGGTIIHRRLPYEGAALESRSIKVNFRPVYGRTYEVMGDSWDSQWCEADEVKAILDLTLELPTVEQNESIAGRIWNTYTPIIAVARMLGDSQFETELVQRMEVVTMTLKEAQASSELDAIAVRALIECLSQAGTLKIGEGVSLRDIRETIWKNTGLTVNPSQLGAIFGDLGFEKRKAHGVTKVYASAAILIQACTELGIEDEAVEQLAKELKVKQG